MPLMKYFDTEHLSESTRRKIARRLEEAREYNPKDFDYHRYEIEKNIYRVNGDFSCPGRTDESGRSIGNDIRFRRGL